MTQLRDHHWKMCYEEAQALGFNEARAEALADLAAQNGKVRFANFNPQQPRDEEGQWTEIGGFHVQTDSGGIIRKGGHVGLHGKHVSEVPGFLEQLKKEPVAAPSPAPATPTTPSQATPVVPAPSVSAAKPMKSPDDLAKALKQSQAAPQTGSPLSGKSVQEIMKLANPSGGMGSSPSWPNPNPLGYNTASFPAGVDGPTFTKAVTDAVAQQATSNPLARLNLQQLYGMVTKTQPMSYGDFQNALAKLDKDGAISLGSYTQNLGQFQQTTGANPDQLMPLNSGYRWYVGPYTGAARMQDDEVPDRYANFNPNEPRAPVGKPEGGEWMKSPGELAQSLAGQQSSKWQARREVGQADTDIMRRMHESLKEGVRFMKGHYGITPQMLEEVRRIGYPAETEQIFDPWTNKFKASTRNRTVSPHEFVDVAKRIVAQIRKNRKHEDRPNEFVESRLLPELDAAIKAISPEESATAPQPTDLIQAATPEQQASLHLLESYLGRPIKTYADALTAYRAGALATHPDRGGDPEAFKKLDETRATLNYEIDAVPERYGLDGRAMRQSHGKSVVHAVARLEALMEREADEDEIEGTVEGIARQFTKAELRDVCDRFGVKAVGHKGLMIERLVEKLMEERE